MSFANFRKWRPSGIPFGLSVYGDRSEPAFLGDLLVGSRLLYRSRNDWRWAAVAKRTEERAVLTVTSPKGGTYRLRRSLWSEIVFDGELPILRIENEEDWRENLADYDTRW
ncbi:MAG: hypothetical protein DWQ47_15690 [Acidobacteria bacterium]|nr:MAG: hypothetical protein DWQ32_03090 [Acidobacteriota bacterium]REK02498.1 MAG: hypothetical protein DWQ38_09045 [Acidobacteriota bacterium]REK13700.1 MAG: hypothetical protein DWQ43_08780 [Acidobacteriota bacterium]REK41694.1 MAG: hypothetical protein DWQ47_15690 [Acidobacteriota bacterium]